MISQEEIVEVLKQCYDPEIPVDLWNLGLIYDIQIKADDDESADVDIVMSLTTPGCGMGGQMAQDITTKLENLADVRRAVVTVTFDPPWTPEMMKDEGRALLGFGAQATSEASPSGSNINLSWE